MDYDSSTRVSTINYGREGRGEGKGVNEVRFNPLYLRMSGLPQTGEAKPIYTWRGGSSRHAQRFSHCRNVYPVTVS